MNYNKILNFFLLLFFLSSCSYQEKDIRKAKDLDVEKKVYVSTGFVLVYNEKNYNDGIINDKLKSSEFVALHPYLKRNTELRIYNPKNLKSVNVRIKKRSDFPKIYKLVITKKTADILDLDLDNPFVEIVQTKKNKKFIAKKADMFDEEKKVATKVPVNAVKVDELTKDEDLKLDKKNILSYNILISDFYYLKSAEVLKNNLLKNRINKLSIIKLNDTKFRLSAGPYEDFNSLKDVYINLNLLGFEELDIYTD